MIAAFLHFFFLSSFCWVLTEAWQSYMAVTGRLRNRIIRKRFLCLGWGGPSVCWPHLVFVFTVSSVTSVWFSLQVFLPWSLPSQWGSRRLKAMGHQASESSECSAAPLLLSSSVFLFHLCWTYSSSLTLSLPFISFCLPVTSATFSSLADPHVCCCHSCWLSLEGGLLYAFVGPAAAVVLVLALFALCI